MAQPANQAFKVNMKVSFEVQIAGEGEPIVYIHGAGGLTWNSFLDELSNRYKVYAPHLPGTANSTGLEEIQDLWELALCYYDLFDALGLDSVKVIGFSMGGMIASELAAIDQSRVKQLVAIAPIGLYRKEHPVADIFVLHPDELLELSVADVHSEAAKQFSYMPEDPAEKQTYLLNRRQTMKAAAKFMWPIPERGLKNRLYRIKAPTLIIWGKKDGIVPVEYAEEFGNQIQNTEVKIIENASHQVTQEKTAEVISLIHHFFQ